MAFLCSCDAQMKWAQGLSVRSRRTSGMRRQQRPLGDHPVRQAEELRRVLGQPPVADLDPAGAGHHENQSDLRQNAALKTRSNLRSQYPWCNGRVGAKPIPKRRSDGRPVKARFKCVLLFPGSVVFSRAGETASRLSTDTPHHAFPVDASPLCAVFSMHLVLFGCFFSSQEPAV